MGADSSPAPACRDVDPATVACVLLEPVQGEGGFIPMPPDYPARLAEVCREHGILYVDDEVQSGVGRTGRMWAIEHYDDVAPDLLVSGKSIGGGLPLAAVTGRAELMDAVPPGGLGGTFAGDPALSFEADLRAQEVAAAEAKRIAEEAAREVHADELRVEHGDVGPAICQVAEEEGADLVVLGTHDRGRWSRLWFGSVSDHVVRHAPCPVLVVRR